MGWTPGASEGGSWGRRQGGGGGGLRRRVCPPHSRRRAGRTTAGTDPPPTSPPRAAAPRPGPPPAPGRRQRRCPAWPGLPTCLTAATAGGEAERRLKEQAESAGRQECAVKERWHSRRVQEAPGDCSPVAAHTPRPGRAIVGPQQAVPAHLPLARLAVGLSAAPGLLADRLQPPGVIAGRRLSWRRCRPCPVPRRRRRRRRPPPPADRQPPQQPKPRALTAGAAPPPPAQNGAQAEGGGA